MQQYVQIRFYFTIDPKCLLEHDFVSVLKAFTSLYFVKTFTRAFIAKLFVTIKKLFNLQHKFERL